MVYEKKDNLTEWTAWLKEQEEQKDSYTKAVDAEIVEVEDNNNSMCAYTHLEICTDEDLSKICNAGDKAKVIIIKQK